MMIGWGNRLRSHNDVSSSNVMFRNENTSISKFTVYKTIRCFEETRSLKNQKQEATATNSEKFLDVLQFFMENPHPPVE